MQILSAHSTNLNNPINYLDFLNSVCWDFQLVRQSRLNAVARNLFSILSDNFFNLFALNLLLIIVRGWKGFAISCTESSEISVSKVSTIYD